MINFLLVVIGISATIFTVSSTIPQITKGLKNKKMDDVSVWLIMALIVGLSLWVTYGIEKRYSNCRRKFCRFIIKRGVTFDKIQRTPKSYKLES